MDPLQQSPQSNPYEFITNPAQPPKQPLFGGSTKSRIIVVVAIIVLLMIGASIVSTFLSSGSRKATQNLKNVAAEQQELIRVAEIGASDATSADVRGYAQTVSLSVKTSQQKVTSLLQSSKVKISNQELASKTDSKLEDTLKAAASNNRYDETLKEVLDKRLAGYLKSLETAQATSDGQSTQAALSEAHASTKIILGNIPL